MLTNISLHCVGDTNILCPSFLENQQSPVSRLVQVLQKAVTQICFGLGLTEEREKKKLHRLNPYRFLDLLNTASLTSSYTCASEF